MAFRFFLSFCLALTACASPDPRPPELGDCNGCAGAVPGGGGGTGGGTQRPGDQGGTSGGNQDENANWPGVDGGGTGNPSVGGRGDGGPQSGNPNSGDDPNADDGGSFIPLGGRQMQGG